jgi:hypothetical protein
VSILGFRQRRIDPDPTPAPEPLSYHNPNHTPDPEPACTCKAFDAIGQNPECAEHPWWRSDPAVLDLADLTRELGSALKAAQRHVVDLNKRPRAGGGS